MYKIYNAPEYFNMLNKVYNLEEQLACACDLLNTWAREKGIMECDNPYKDLELRNLVDRIWAKVSQ